MMRPRSPARRAPAVTAPTRSRVTIQFEDFDLGGPGVGYFTPAPVANTLYRSGTIAIERNANESGFHLTGTRYQRSGSGTRVAAPAGRHVHGAGPGLVAECRAVLSR